VARLAPHGIEIVSCEYIDPPHPVSQALHDTFGFKELGTQWFAGDTQRNSLQVVQARRFVLRSAGRKRRAHAVSRNQAGTMTRHALVLLLLAGSCAAHATEGPSCASDALSHAAPLLTLHFGEGDRISIGDEAKELPSIRNPANPRQRLKVYEVWGYIYKGQYRMRFIYHASEVSGCTLVGQEILEYARV
jgi:hypothetical protein